MAHSNHSNATQNININEGAISIVAGIDIALMVIALLLNILAMALQISTLKMRHLSNQSILLIHLNVVSFFNIITNAWSVAIFGYDIKFTISFMATYQAAYVAYILNLILLTSDRLLYVILELKYRKYIKPMASYFAILFIWVGSIATGVTLGELPYSKRKPYNEYSHHVFNGFTTCYAAVAYVFIIGKVMYQTNIAHGGNNAGLSKNRYRMLRKFALPFAIVMTFFLFNYVPSIVVNHVELGEDRTLVVVGLIGVNILNIISDPLCYIFLQPKIKKQIKKFNKHVVAGIESTKTNTGFEMDNA